MKRARIKRSSAWTPFFSRDLVMFASRRNHVVATQKVTRAGPNFEFSHYGSLKEYFSGDHFDGFADLKIKLGRQTYKENFLSFSSLLILVLQFVKHTFQERTAKRTQRL